MEHATRSCVPLEVALELTHRCNYRCRHCYLPEHTGGGELSLGRLLRLLEELAEAGTLFLTLTGGEPLLRPEWSEVARRARALGFAVTVLTNGSLVDDAAADLLADLGTSVGVSLYSLEEGRFEAVTGVRGSLGRTLAGIESLRARGVRTELKVPLTTETPDAAREVAAFADEIGARWRGFARLSAARDGARTPLDLRLDGEQELVREAELRGEPGCASPGDHEPADDGPLCAAGSRYAVVTPEGDVLACNLLARSAGNLYDASFGEIWSTSPWLATLRALRRSDLRVCVSCPSFPVCGRCPAQALLEDGDLLGPSRAACAYAAARHRLPCPAS